jgi:sugar phosphate permease
MSRLGYHGWWVMLGCIACQMDLGFAKDTMDVYMTYIVADFGWGRADFQVAGWALLASFSAMSPAIGYLLDRLGARVVLTTGALALGLTFAAYASMTSFAHYLLITPLLGAGIVAMGDIPVSTIVSRWFERRRGTVLGIVLIGSNIGAAVVNLLAKGLYRGFDDQWRPAIVVLGVVMVASVLPFSLWVIRDPRREEVPSRERATTAGPHSPPAPAPDAASDGRWTTSSRLADAVGTRSFWLLVFALFAYYFYYLFVNRHIIALLRDQGSFGHTVPAPLVSLLGVSPQDFPEFTKSMFEAAGLPGKLLAGYLVDRYRVRHALAWNFVLLAAGSALLPVLDGSGVIWIFIAANGLGWGAQQVLTPMAIASTFGLRHMGQIYGTLMIVLFPAHVSPWYAGRVFDLAGTYNAFFAPCVALNVLAAAGLFLLRPWRA